MRTTSAELAALKVAALMTHTRPTTELFSELLDDLSPRPHTRPMCCFEEGGLYVTQGKRLRRRSGATRAPVWFETAERARAGAIRV